MKTTLQWSGQLLWSFCTENGKILRSETKFVEKSLKVTLYSLLEFWPLWQQWFSFFSFFKYQYTLSNTHSCSNNLCNHHSCCIISPLPTLGAAGWCEKLVYVKVLNVTVDFTLQTVGNYWVVSAAATMNHELRTMFTKAQSNLFPLFLSMILGLVFLKTRQRLLVLFSVIGSETGCLLVLNSLFYSTFLAL